MKFIKVCEEFLRVLERFVARDNISVAYTDDFGHGTKHAILPIGVDVEFYADK